MKRKIETCDGCQLPLGAARLVVHDGTGGKEGQFHVNCYAPDAISGAIKREDVVAVKRLHADFETLCGVE